MRKKNCVYAFGVAIILSGNVAHSSSDNKDIKTSVESENQGLSFFKTEDELVKRANEDWKRALDNNPRAIAQVKAMAGDVTLLIGIPPDSYAIKRFPAQDYPNYVFLDLLDEINVQNQEELRVKTPEGKPYANIDFSRPFLFGNVNSIEYLKELAGYFPGKFSRIIFDYKVAKFIFWTPAHLEEVHQLLKDGGELYIAGAEKELLKEFKSLRESTGLYFEVMVYDNDDHPYPFMHPHHKAKVYILATKRSMDNRPPPTPTPTPPSPTMDNRPPPTPTPTPPSPTMDNRPPPPPYQP